MAYGADNHFTALIRLIETELLPELSVNSEQLHEPVVVVRLPQPWKLVGAGNYAVVLSHPEYPRLVIKIYAPNRHGLQEEAEVYRRLGRHPAYSECYHYGGSYLVLRRLEGVTLYDCVRKGIPIPRRVIEDIDEALAYAVARGLNPHDVHGKNVMMKDGRGMVVDVSDFLKTDACTMWTDLKKAYHRFYLRVPLLHRIPVPDFVMNAVRRGYRAMRKRRGSC
ncbi:MULTISPECIES: serine/threonine protein kinase [Paenibacillus]|uniref:serine/threonine protein kinase n=1 Tax=Paenibacillus TaxID=44249 RepID=UPI0022B8918B|nr:serine/threonine protein kinase [Paenibacillus caseinilyticus]